MCVFVCVCACAYGCVYGACMRGVAWRGVAWQGRGAGSTHIMRNVNFSGSLCARVPEVRGGAGPRSGTLGWLSGLTFLPCSCTPQSPRHRLMQMISNTSSKMWRPLAETPNNKDTSGLSFVFCCTTCSCGVSICNFLFNLSSLSFGLGYGLSLCFRIAKLPPPSEPIA